MLRRCPSGLASFCKRNGIGHEWFDADTMRTAQANRGKAQHRVPGERAHSADASRLQRWALAMNATIPRSDLLVIDR